MGGKFKGQPQSGSFIRMHFFSAPNCGGSQIDTADLSLNGITSDWAANWQSFTTPTGTMSANIGAYGLQLYVDQMFVNTSNQF